MRQRYRDLAALALLGAWAWSLPVFHNTYLSVTRSFAVGLIFGWLTLWNGARRRRKAERPWLSLLETLRTVSRETKGVDRGDQR